MAIPPWFTVTRGDGPIVAAALHAGHAVRPEVEALLALGEEERRREEDPFTDLLTAIAPSRLVAHRSRFEVDLNRPREAALYREPGEAWGLTVWRWPPPGAVRDESLALYDAFYAAAGALLADLAARHGSFVVLDLHSYNHRRDGPEAPPADPASNPEINLGTATLLSDRWAPLVDGLRRALAEADYQGRRLDVRENVSFQGGDFPRWVNSTFRDRGCCVALELKKIFMDEWTGALDGDALAALIRVLRLALPALRRELPSLAGVS